MLPIGLIAHQFMKPLLQLGVDPGGFKGFHGTPFGMALVLLDELLTTFSLNLVSQDQ